MAAILAYTGLFLVSFFATIALVMTVLYLVCELLATPKHTFLPMELLNPLVQLSEVLSEDDLCQYDGTDLSKPLLMAIKGQIYDGLQSRRFYKPDGPYALFTGEDAKQQEPTKRMRRWNSGNQLVAETAKPLTTEIKKGLAAIAPKILPKTLGQSRSLATEVRVDPDAHGDNRAVPPSTHPPSSFLKIERFACPFTLKAAKDMLAEIGSCSYFWMDQIKTHCYVPFLKADEAVATYYGNHLVADFVDASEVKIRCDGSFKKSHCCSTINSMEGSSSSASNPSPVTPLS